jgi:HD-GYP domain-containing protein (c-di-GMP phosphodiesterase class II)
LPQHASTREDLVRVADQAQYAAKHAGKGRVGTPEEVSFAFHKDPAMLASQLEHADLGAIEALAAAVDTRDPYNRGHSQRVSSYATALAGALNLPLTDVLRVQLAGLLHDVGKIGIPDSILSKPGKLTDDEYRLVQQHPIIGEHMLAAVPFLREVLPAIRHHHERWDGDGYPDGLAATEIPRDASILAIADALETMTSDRPYRAALPLSEAIRRIVEGAGTQFDPAVVAALEQAVNDGSLALLLPDLPASLYMEAAAWAS